MSTAIRTLVAAASIVAIQGGLQLVQDAGAQQANTSSPPPAADSASLALQRSIAIYNFKTTAERGPLRGEEIYYFKCWICHNSYTIDAKTGAVPLKGLFKRSKLSTTGQPVSDETVAEKIRRGSARMPAYRYVLSDVDMADLLSYLRDDQCCFEDEPPRNPWYRGEER
jgi:mono/diheme cytochrome c family protein